MLYTLRIRGTDQRPMVAVDLITFSARNNKIVVYSRGRRTDLEGGKRLIPWVSLARKTRKAAERWLT